MASFTIDTHLFRELGELLVGRDSTALIELIKNSYDADATEVIVVGQRLNDPDRGVILITDNGSGMTPDQFEQGFLRVASRMKDDGLRLSGRLKRRYTGAKGIGRLAAHKLARLLEVQSISVANGGTVSDVQARIDWDKIELFETLDQIEGSDAVVVMQNGASPKAKTGTALRLSRLRRKWTPAERARFFAEVESFAPPPFLTKQLRKSIVAEPLVFNEPLVRGAEASGQEFSVKLEGEFAAGEEYWQLMEEHAAWVIEIRSRVGEPVQYAVAPTKRTLRERPGTISYRTSVVHPAPDVGPFFDARIFLRVGPLAAKGDKRTWATRTSGIRVFMEGFRVLPYGEPHNDWLRLDSDYTRRSRTLDTLKDWDLDDLDPIDGDAPVMGFPNNNYFGGVFLTHDNAPSLRMLVNREGFIPEGGYDDLVVLVRTGLDLCTRVQAAASYPDRKARSETRKRGHGNAGGAPASPAMQDPTAAPGRIPTGPITLKASLDSATEALSAARAHWVAAATASRSDEAAELAKKLSQALEEIRAQADSAEEMISEQSLLRVLASVGTQMSAFVHEIRALLGASQAVEHALDELASDPQLMRDQRQKLKKILQAIGDLRRGLEREASYLTDIVTPDARRRRSRQRLAERFDVASRLLAHTAERRGIRIESQIGADLKSPPMFPAELTAVFTNLLSNAVKAAGLKGRIVASAGSDPDGTVHVLIQNSGVRVDLARAEAWFRPFESTTSEVDPVLGQGMGLGLPITRRMLDDYGAEIAFVAPENGFATAIKFMFPGDK
ncbi:sensor histidine kinase [Vulgatibacter incomptus]|uniref:histidine kinase n=1 Tax=Vulgatibacter incomptus TaxID=1391653 RepID=A0A0K1PGK2_9BACT|nr:sensor histidine kinase [Vulgatibacter incomptus]AKU92650.1 putative two-component system sensor histidine kinase, putative heat shock protein [Vulgatibacter incomptus]